MIEIKLKRIFETRSNFYFEKSNFQYFANELVPSSHLLDIYLCDLLNPWEYNGRRNSCVDSRTSSITATVSPTFIWSLKDQDTTILNPPIPLEWIQILVVSYYVNANIAEKR